MNDFKKYIESEMFKALRLAEGLTQNEFATALGVSQSKLSKIESGHLPDISLAIAQNAAKTYNFSMDDFLNQEFRTYKFDPEKQKLLNSKYFKEASLSLDSMKKDLSLFRDQLKREGIDPLIMHFNNVVVNEEFFSQIDRITSRVPRGGQTTSNNFCMSL